VTSGLSRSATILSAHLPIGRAAAIGVDFVTVVLLLALLFRRSLQGAAHFDRRWQDVLAGGLVSDCTVRSSQVSHRLLYGRTAIADSFGGRAGRTRCRAAVGLLLAACTILFGCGGHEV